MSAAEALVRELWIRILADGEPLEAVLADFEQRRAAHQAAFDAEGERLQAEIDACTVTMLACQGRLQ